MGDRTKCLKKWSMLFAILLFSCWVLHSQEQVSTTGLKQQALEQLTILEQQIADLQTNLQSAQSDLQVVNSSLADAQRSLEAQQLQLQNLEASLTLSQTINKIKNGLLIGAGVVIIFETFYIILR